MADNSKSSLFNLDSAIDFDRMRNAYSVYFTFNGKPYYADVVSRLWLHTSYNEVMIFMVENGEINFSEVYCAHPSDVNKATLLEHIAEFCSKNSNAEAF